MTDRRRSTANGSGTAAGADRPPRRQSRADRGTEVDVRLALLGGALQSTESARGLTLAMLGVDIGMVAGVTALWTTHLLDSGELLPWLVAGLLGILITSANFPLHRGFYRESLSKSELLKGKSQEEIIASLDALLEQYDERIEGLEYSLQACTGMVLIAFMGSAFEWIGRASAGTNPEAPFMQWAGLGLGTAGQVLPLAMLDERWRKRLFSLVDDHQPPIVNRVVEVVRRLRPIFITLATLWMGIGVLLVGLSAYFVAYAAHNSVPIALLICIVAMAVPFSIVWLANKWLTRAERPILLIRCMYCITIGGVLIRTAQAILTGH